MLSTVWSGLDMLAQQQSKRSPRRQVRSGELTIQNRYEAYTFLDDALLSLMIEPGRSLFFGSPTRGRR